MPRCDCSGTIGTCAAPANGQGTNQGAPEQPAPAGTPAGMNAARPTDKEFVAVAAKTSLYASVGSTTRKPDSIADITLASTQTSIPPAGDDKCRDAPAMTRASKPRTTEGRIARLVQW